MIIYTPNDFIQKQDFGTNLFHIGNLDSTAFAKMFANVTGRSFDEGVVTHWGTRTDTITRNFNILFSSPDRFTRADFESVVYADGISNMYASDISQVSKSIASWKRIDDIRNGAEGSILTLDTETYGDVFTKGTKSNGLFGITEIGVARTTYKNGNIYLGDEAAKVANRISGSSLYADSIVDAADLSKGYTETIITAGMGKEETSYMNNIVRKWQNKGWNSLLSDEKVMMRRASVYANASFEPSKIFEGLYAMKGASEQVTDINLSRLGITKLAEAHNLYANNNITDSDIIFRVLNESGIINSEGVLTDTITSRKEVLNLANSGFDMPLIADVLRRSDNPVYKTAADSISNSSQYIADTTYMVRALAAVNGMTPDELMRSRGFHGGGASMESLLDSISYTIEQMHSAGSDDSNQRLVTNALSKVITDADYEKLTAGSDGLPPTLKKISDEQMIFLKKGVLNNKEGLEFAVVNGDTLTQSMSIRGSFYSIDADRTGWGNFQIPKLDDKGNIIYEDTRRYAVTLTKRADEINGVENPMKILLTGESPEEVGRRLSQNGFILNKSSITDFMVNSQEKFTQADIARREFDRFLNPTDVAYASKGEGVNGFNGLKQLLARIDELGINEGDYNTPDGVAKIMRIAKEKGVTMRGYEAQKLAGLSGMVNGQRPILNTLISNIEDKVPESANASLTNYVRTQIFRDSYNEVISNLGVPDSSYIRNMYDRYGIDLKVADNIIRVDAQRVEDAASGFNSIVKNHMMNGAYIDRDMLNNTLQDLVDRNVLTEQTYKSINFDTLDAKNMYNNLVLPVAADLNNNNRVQTGIIRELGTELETARMLTYNGVSIGEKLANMTDSIIGPNGEVYNYPNFTDSNILSGISGIVDDNVAKNARFIPLGTGPFAERNDYFGEQLKGILNGLNIKEQNDYNLVYHMFYNTEKQNKEGELIRYTLGQQGDGMSYAIVTPDDGSRAYVLSGKDRNLQKVISDMSEGKYDLSSFNRLTNNDEIYKYAAVFEIPKINEYKIRANEGPLGIGTIRTYTLGDTHEIMLTPELNITSKVNSNGIEEVNMYLNSGVYDLGSSYRIHGERAVSLMKDGDNKAASMIVRNEQISKLMDRPGSSSSRALMRNGRIVRSMQFNPADILQADAIKIGDAIDTLFEKAIKTENDDLFEVINTYIQQRGIGDIMPRLKINNIDESDVDYFTRVFNSSRSGFKEYFKKHQFINFGEDNVLELSDNLKGTNFYKLMKHSIFGYEGSKIIFGVSLKGVKDPKKQKDFQTIWQKIESVIGGDENTLGLMADPSRSVGAYQHGYIGVGGINSAYYNLYASSSNTIRPTYGQMNNPVSFDIAQLEKDMSQLSDTINGEKLGFTRFLANAPVGNINLTEAYDMLANNEMARQVIEGKGLDFTMTFRNMNDVDLADKLATLKRMSAPELRKALGITNNNTIFNDISRIHKALDYISSSFNSLEEGSMLIHPMLMRSEAIASAEGSNLTLPLERMNIEKTRNRLSEIAQDTIKKNKGKLSPNLKRGDIIGFMNDGTPYYYTGNDAFFDTVNAKELIPDELNVVDDVSKFKGAGKTKIAEAGFGDYSIRKLHIGGNEKAMGRSISPERIAELTDYNLKISKQIADGVFDYLGGGAMAVGNFNIEKHGNNFFMQNRWNVMTNLINQEGKTQDFYNYLSKLTDLLGESNNNNEIVIGGIRIRNPEVAGGRLLMDDSNAGNASKTINDIYERLVGSANTENAIYSNADDMRAFIGRLQSAEKALADNNMVFIRAQRQNVNPFMGDFMTINARVQQAMYLLGQGEGTTQETTMMLSKNARYIDMMREYSGRYNARFSQSSGTFSTFLDTISAGMNRERIQSSIRSRTAKATRSLGGLYGVLDDFASITGTQGNYATIKVSDLIDNADLIPRAGATRNANAIAYYDGDPSEFTARVTKGKNKDFIRLDLEGAEITYNIGEQTYKKSSILIPIHDIDTKISANEYSLMSEQKATTSFLNAVASAKRNLKENETTNERISRAYSTYIRTVTEELSRDNKKSSVFKNNIAYVMPTSTQMQASDEASALVEELANNKDFVNAVKEEEEVARQLSQAGMSKEVNDETTNMIRRYARVVSQKNSMMGAVADRIENGEFLDLAINANPYIKDAMRAIGSDGKRHYGMVASISQEAFEKMGLSMNSISYDIIRDYEASTGLYNVKAANVPKVFEMFNLDTKGRMANISDLEWNKYNIAKEKSRIIDSINNTLRKANKELDKESQYVLFEKNRSLIEQLNELTDKVYEISDDAKRMKRGKFNRFLGSKINEDIANNGPSNVLFRVARSFTNAETGESLGSQYLERIGIYAQLFRQPIFSSQPLSRVMLDKSMNGLGMTVRMWNPLYTAKMHVDFDGDTMFLSAMLDGSSVLKSNDVRYKDLADLYDTYVTRFSNKGMAEYVRDGSYAKTNMLYSDKAQRASILQLINEKEYNNAVKGFKESDSYKAMSEALAKDVESGAITQDSMDTVLKLAVAHSDTVNEAFEKAAVNFSTNPKMIIASMAAKERNLYIGSVSTPNFKLRDTLVALFNNTSDRPEMRNMINEVLNDFTSTGSTVGGLLSLFEQKAIDTKKAIDALNISEIGLYTLGIEQVKNAGRQTSKYTRKSFEQSFSRGIGNVIRGAGPNIYSFLREDNADELLDVFTKIAADKKNDFAGLNKMINDISESISNGKIYQYNGVSLNEHLDIIKTIKSMRGLAEIYANPDNQEILEAFDLFTKTGFRYTDDIVDQLNLAKKLSEQTGQNAYDFTGTSLEGLYKNVINVQRQKEAAEKAMNSFTASSFEDNYIYYIPEYEQSNLKLRGAYNNEIEPFGMGFFRKNEEGLLVRMDLVDNGNGSLMAEETPVTLNPRTLTRKQLNAIYEAGKVDAGMFINNDNGIIESTIKNVTNLESRRLYDDYIESTINGKSVKDFSALMGSEYYDRLKDSIRFVESSNASELSELFDAYSSIASENLSNTSRAIAYANNADTSLNLGRQINKIITDNGPRNFSDYGDVPEKKIVANLVAMGYNSPSDFSSYNEAAEKIMISNLKEMGYNNPEEVLMNRRNLSRATGGNISQISDVLANFERNVYNVAQEEDYLRTEYNTLRAQFTAMNRNPKVKQETLDAMEELLNAEDKTIEELLGKINVNNSEMIKNTQDTVYDLINKNGQGEFTDKLNVIFGYNKPSADSRVAFGNLMNRKFSNLGSEDIENILKASTDGLNEYEAKAVTATQEALKKYQDLKPLIKKGTSFGNINGVHFQGVNDVVSSLDTARQTAKAASGLSEQEIWQNMQDEIKEQMNAAREANKLNKKTLSGKILNKKTIGFAAGAMIAIGVANSIIHGKNNDSPLVPQRNNSDNGDEPSYDAPGTPKALQNDKNIYVDQKKGFSFKINAKTKSKMLAMNAASAANNYGNGGGSIRIRSDNSKINANWLENRFAELSE